MVLGALVILTIFVTQLQQSTSSTLSAALAERDALRAEYHAKSATHLARLLIAAEPTVQTVLQPILSAMFRSRVPIKQIPVWRFSDTVLGIFNDREHSQAFADAAGVDLGEQGTAKNIGTTGGYFELEIVDEGSKINVNAASSGDPFARLRFAAQFLGLTSPPQFAPLFQREDPDGQFSDRRTICGAIVDWSDYDEALYPCDPFGSASPNDAAEDGVYANMGVPYARRNAPFDSIEELRLVRGVSDTFWATFVDPDPNDADARMLTAWGEQRVNVNTANPRTLLAVVCGAAPDAVLCNDQVQMETFITVLELARNLLGGVPLFVNTHSFLRSLQGRGWSPVASLFKALGLEPVVFRSPRELLKAITTESKVFSIYADGVVPGRIRETRIRVHSVIDFRNAAKLGAGADPASANEAAPKKGARWPNASTAPSSAPEDPDSRPPTEADIIAALLSDPLGTPIYFRIE